LPNLDGYDKWDATLKEKRTVKFISLGAQSSYFSGSYAVGDARLIVQQLLADGADIILPVAGPQVIDACAEIESQNSPTKVIGVDTDQENSDLGNYISRSKYKDNGEKIIICSAQKDIAFATSAILQAAAYGYRGYHNDDAHDTDELIRIKDDARLTEYSENAIGSFGYLTSGNVKNKCVKISKSGQDYLKKAIENLFGKRPPDDYYEIIN
jgi:basic membrane lipoprotein Med (substrate-binding protein (PBP1-ABC) superfamily)